MYNKIKYHKFIIIVLSIISNSVQFAQSNSYSDRLNVLVLGGFNLAYSDYNSKSMGSNFILGIDYLLPAKTKTNISVSLSTGYLSVNGIDNNLELPNTFSTSIVPISLAVEYNRYFRKGFIPFIGTGFSYYLLSFSDEEFTSRIIEKSNIVSKNSFAWDINAGVKYLLNKKIVLKFQMGLHFVLSDNIEAIQIGNHNDFLGDINFGISYNIWGKKDTDGDGIFDTEDNCPNEMEDFDGFEDDDGCPDIDNDGDGINDNNDLCVNIAEDIDGYKDDDGCPDLDNDGDSIPDSIDNCINEAEDFDGFEDTDGCPDIDNDGDGIIDTIDKCPNRAENKNGYQDEDGCPDVIPQNKINEELNKEINVFNEYILHGETTFEKNTFILKKSVIKKIKTIAKTMIENPGIMWRIEGHVEKNKSRTQAISISTKYAESVRSYLVSLGVSPEKLSIAGIGDSVPIATNNTVFGRMKNKRVRILRLN